jgi:hypothetical protein
MNSLSIVCMFIAMAATLGVLIAGIFSMVKGGEFNKKWGNKLMRYRVILQGVALAFLALAFVTSKTT